MRQVILAGACAAGCLFVATTASAQAVTMIPATDVEAALTQTEPVTASDSTILLLPAPLPAPDPAQIASPPGPLVLPADTPVHLMVINEVTTKTHAAGHRFSLRVDKPVTVDGAVVVPVGAIAWGEVTSAESSGNVGRSGKLSARLLYLEVGDHRVGLSGETNARGKSGTAETVMGVLGTGLLGLFAKGNNAKLKAGEHMTAFTTEPLELGPVAPRLSESVAGVIPDALEPSSTTPR